MSRANRSTAAPDAILQIFGDKILFPVKHGQHDLYKSYRQVTGPTARIPDGATVEPD